MPSKYPHLTVDAILERMVHGKKLKEIGYELGAHWHTVDNRLREARKAAGLKTIYQLLARYVEAKVRAE